MKLEKLTDRGLKSLKATGKRYDLSFGKSHPGLIVRVSARGEVSFWFRYQFGNLRRKMFIGNYPAVKLVDLLSRYLELRKTLAQGIDPLELQKEEESKYDPTVKQFAEEYLTWCESRGLKPTTLKEYRRIFARYVCRPQRAAHSLERVKVSSLTRKEISGLVNYIATRMPNKYQGAGAKGAPTQANRVLAVLSGLCRYAVERGLLEFNPATAVRKPGAVRSRDRYLTMEEIRTTHDIIKAQASREIYDAFMVALLTGQRVSQVAGLRLDWIKGEQLEFPAAKMKSGRRHIIHVSPQLQRLIEARKADGLTTDYLFPGEGENLPHIHPDSLKRGLARRMPAIEAAALKRFSFHDLRRTVATHLNRLGFRGLDRAILGHSDIGVTDVHYNRYDLAREIKAALDAWGLAVERAITGIAGAEVIPITQQNK